MTNAYPSFSTHYPSITPFLHPQKHLKWHSAEPLFVSKGVIRRDCFYQNTVFVLKFSKLCHIHRLKQFQNGLHTLKRGYKKKFIFDEGIEKFESYMENEHSLKPHLIIISKGEKSTR